MLKNLLLVLTIFFCTSLSAQIWDGGGDGTSWDDAINWSTDTIPAVGANVTFPDGITAYISGTAPNVIRRIILDTLSAITLDLDLDFMVAGNPVHSINLKENAQLTLGGSSDMRTFNIATGISRNAILLNSNGASITISEQATLNVDTCQNAIRVTKAGALFVNNGTFNIVGYNEHGVNLIRGNFTNNGTLDIGIGVDNNDVISDGINVGNDGVFDNNAGGSISVNQPLDDGLEVLGVFNNAGTISTFAKDNAASGNNGIAVGDVETGGIMHNLATGIINAEGSVGAEDFVLSVLDLASLTNEGTINISGGDPGQAFVNRGTLVNETCAQIDIAEGRISNNSAGIFTNNGLITSTYNNAGVRHNALNGSAINNSFYSYTNADVFSSGNAESVDNGQNASMGITIDAANSCTIADIGIDASYTWFTDLAGTIEAGTNDENGLLTLNDDIFEEAGNHTLYTCFGETVQLNLENVSGNCTILNGVDFIELTNVFTLMPNPAQAYTQLKFDDEFIANEKSIKVYNAVGQLVQKANLNGVENYILNTNDFASGIYTINLQTEKGMQIERLIIQK